ncbi:amino acid transporter [Longimycelium tulufanense]|uniref:Amino acid transporter n=1 Tax=Longimycelium tulufanense TaxID=907463 RepID=A0A8J3FVP7_9PSEU|nr:amino acid permease [Longimycelium tulufanense]GGM70547.1 amino acid transporter [Longimycelium tulufanense]
MSAPPGPTPTDARPAAAEPTRTGVDDGSRLLGHGLRQRHLAMIALGGVIGAGLFVGSRAGIAAAGPSIVLGYLLAGGLVMLMMRILGEMSAAAPAAGSFSVYAERAIGPWAGLTSGWMYWSLLVVGVGIEAIGAAEIVHGWVPMVPPWAWILLIMIVFCGTNLAAVRNFGEAEFWFAALKIGAIVFFLVLGSLAILGVLPGTPAPGLSHLTGDGGLFPNGTGGFVAGLLTAVAAYAGLETVTIAAAESERPSEAVGKAVRSAIWRILVFYVGSMAVIVTLLPWNASELKNAGPYVAVLDRLQIPGAGQIMNVVVLIALLSAINANIYGSSRMAFSLVRRGQGPRVLAGVTAGVPRRAVLASSAFGFFTVLLAYWWPDTVFRWLLNAVGGATLVVWAFTAVSQLRLRRRLEREAPEKLVARMPWHPYLTWLSVAGIGAVLVLMGMNEETRVQLVTTAVVAGALALSGWLRQRRLAAR